MHWKLGQPEEKYDNNFPCPEFPPSSPLLSDTKKAEIPIAHTSTSSTSSKSGAASSAKNQKEPAVTEKNISDKNQRPTEDSGEELVSIGKWEIVK